MTDYVFDPFPVASVAVAGTDRRFPVRRIFCVGRNYADHAREMGNDPTREPPFFFTKPADAVVDSGAVIPYPSLTEKLHHEVELVVAIGTRGNAIAAEDAARHIFGYAVGIDLTRRDLQEDAKATRRPWDWSKAFDASAPCSPLVPANGADVLTRGRLWLSVNGTVRQDGDIAEMIWPVADIVAACSRAVRLEAGDLIYTGTPAGVGPLVRGDKVTGGLDGIGRIDLTIDRQ